MADGSWVMDERSKLKANKSSKLKAASLKGLGHG